MNLDSGPRAQRIETRKGLRQVANILLGKNTIKNYASCKTAVDPGSRIGSPKTNARIFSSPRSAPSLSTSPIGSLSPPSPVAFITLRTDDRCPTPSTKLSRPQSATKRGTSRTLSCSNRPRSPTTAPQAITRRRDLPTIRDGEDLPRFDNPEDMVWGTVGRYLTAEEQQKLEQDKLDYRERQIADKSQRQKEYGAHLKQQRQNANYWAAMMFYSSQHLQRQHHMMVQHRKHLMVKEAALFRLEHTVIPFLASVACAVITGCLVAFFTGYGRVVFCIASFCAYLLSPQILLFVNTIWAMVQQEKTV